MDYTCGTAGRIFVLKFSHHDDLLQELTRFAKKEKIKTATILLMGALAQADVVTGPKRPILPPQPQWESVQNGWEIVGMGTIFSDQKGPHLHIHCALGRGKKSLTGCLRKKAKVFLVVEAVVWELKNVRAGKKVDPVSGLELLYIENLK